jgi:hypothetical protein
MVILWDPSQIPKLTPLHLRRCRTGQELGRSECVFPLADTCAAASTPGVQPGVPAACFMRIRTAVGSILIERESLAVALAKCRMPSVAEIPPSEGQSAGPLVGGTVCAEHLERW